GGGIDPQGGGGVGGGAARRSARHQVPRRRDTGKVADGAGQRAGDEAELHGDGETGAAAGAQLPFALEGGEDGGRAEPETEREQLGQRQRGELPPALGHVLYSTTFFA